MFFNSWEFLILLLVTFTLYYVPVKKSFAKVWQIWILLIASAIFYAWENPQLLILLFASCAVNTVAVERILYWKSAKNAPNAIASSKQWLIWTIALNLGCLVFFKYAAFFSELFPNFLISSGIKNWLSSIPLPVGISFYTFQGLSMVVDVWRNDITDETRESFSRKGFARFSSLRDTTFYIAFFPQLVAGPIVKAHEFVDQIASKFFQNIDWLTVRRGLITGYFLKVFVADNLSEQTSALTLGPEVLAANGPLNLLPLLYGYSLQIFADFAGYSLIAIGLGALFGYKLPPNFNFPYLSRSITEFWRRWHLSLSSWLRDYLYIPLGGNRKGNQRTYINLMLVMFLGGLWHGAAWKFALWGTLHGLFLSLERYCGAGSTKQKGSEVNLTNKSLLGSVTKQKSPWRMHFLFTLFKNLLSWLFTFHLITLLWLTFLMPDMQSILAFFKGVLKSSSTFSGPPIFSLVFYGTAVIAYHLWGWLREHRVNFTKRILRSPLEAISHGIMLYLVISNPGAPRGFIYFQF